jgi:hypothetical protein
MWESIASDVKALRGDGEEESIATVLARLGDEDGLPDLSVRQVALASCPVC